MDNTHINIRIFSWHFQWPKGRMPGISRNGWHKSNGWPDGYFQVYRFFWYAA